jgi:hypothetical protein
VEVTGLRFRAGAWSGPWPAWDGPSTLVLAFGPSAAPPALDQLRRAFPRSVLAGCSSAGEIYGDHVDDDTLAVAVARFDQTALRAVSTDVANAHGSYGAGCRLADQLDGPGLAYVLVLSDGLRVNGTELVRGLNESLGDRVIVTGGLAGDGARFARTWVLAGGQARSDTVSAVGFYGDRLRVGHGSRGGWDRFGPERTVTRSEGNVVYEVDRRPALALYKEYLGERASGLPATGLLFPLEIRAPDDDKRLVRTILAVDEASQSLTFAGDVPTGWRAQLMKANFDRLVTGAADAAERTARASGDGPTLAIAISCVGRRLVLGERTEEEVEATLAALPPGTVQVGFYSYGELSPLTAGTCDLHNQTMTLTALREA